MDSIPPPPGPPARAEPSTQEIEAILARAEREHCARFPVEPKSPTGCLTGWATGTIVSRLLFTTAGLILISHGVDGLRTRAVSTDSLIAVNINKQGGQSLGLGFAMLAFATLPYPAGKGD